LSLHSDGTLQEDQWHLVDAKGNVLALTQEGDIVVKRLVVKDLELAKGGSVTLPAGESQITGKITIPEGLTSTIIENSRAKTTSKIFLTLTTSPPMGISYAVVNKKEGHFMIQLSEGAPYPLDFDYWIVDTYNANFDAQQNATSTPK